MLTSSLVLAACFSVMFGYGGFRLDVDHLTVNPHPLPQTTHWAVRGLHYRGFTLDLEVFRAFFKIIVTEMVVTGKRIFILDKDNQVIRLAESVSRARAPVNIYIKDSTKDKRTSKGSNIGFQMWLAAMCMFYMWPFG